MHVFLPPYQNPPPPSPVVFHPWGEETFALAVAMDLPVAVFCGIDEGEGALQDPITRDILRAHYICIVLDRAQCAQAYTRLERTFFLLSGMYSDRFMALLLPDERPFYVGSRIEADSSGPYSGIRAIISRVAQRWENERSNIMSWAQTLADAAACEDAAQASSVHALRKHCMAGAPSLSISQLSFLLFLGQDGDKAALDLARRALKAHGQAKTAGECAQLARLHIQVGSDEACRRELSFALKAFKGAEGGYTVHAGDEAQTLIDSAFMLAALSAASVRLGSAGYHADCVRVARFICEKLFHAEAVYAYYAKGEAQGAASLRGYAAAAFALLSFSQCSREMPWRRTGLLLLRRAIARFTDPNGRVYELAEQAQRREVHSGVYEDDRLPSGAALLLESLMLGYRFVRDPEYLNIAKRLIDHSQLHISQQPWRSAHMITSIQRHKLGWESPLQGDH